MKQKQKIVFLLPGHGAQACGGYKVVYEYANRLAADGCQVHIAYAGSLFWKKKTLYFKLTNIVRYLQQWLKGYSCRKWFTLDSRVKEHWCFSLNEQHVPKGDIYVATSPYTAMYLKDYKTTAKRFYFIQGYENWGDVTDKRLRETYHYPLHKIVISGWLQKIMEEEQEPCTKISNGFDFSYFRKDTEPESRNAFCISLCHHESAGKGCSYAYEALEQVRQKYPQLHVLIFSAYAKPINLPDWYTFHRMPNRELHNTINNQASIFIAPSLDEGWGLTVGEAMMCGQAVVCTNNRGFREMAEHEVNALMVPTKDSKALADAIIRLIEDDALRIRLAKAGYASIQRFQWDTSYTLLCKTFGIKKDTTV